MSINQVGINYNNYDYRTKAIGNTPAVNSMSLSNNPFDMDTFQLSSKATVQQSSSTDIAELKKDLQETKSKQGLIGKIWDGFKNLTGIGAGSNKAEKAIEDFEKGKISEEEMLKKVNGYKEGQKTCVDVVADVASGILAVGAFALAVPTGGASLAVGLGLATAVGVGVKVGVKASDALLNDREYTGKDLLYDTATGAINGLLAPLTNGLGNTVTKTIGKKLGLKVVQEGAEEVAEQAVKQGFKQGLKSAVLNQSTDVVGGSLAKRAVSLGAGLAVDGALGGAGDNMVRAALNGENIIKAGIQGAVGGLIMAPIIGGGFRVAGKAGRALNGKIIMSKVLPDGISTKFKQGSVGDCALLSTIDGMMNNPTTAKALKKSITKTIGGDYNVKIGDKIVKVAKSSLTDEMLSDTTGIKIFEQAYKQINGSLDGGFAEVVAKQFGLNPVHIVNESITDELLDTLAKNQGDTVLSFGALVDTNGSISNVNGQRHYFTIKNIDPDTKMVKLTSPTDTSQVIELSYEQVRNMGISIDGGTTKNIDLPTSARNLDDEMFRGVDSDVVFMGIDGAEEDQLIRDEIRERIYSRSKLSDENYQYVSDDVRTITSQLDRDSRFRLLGEPVLNNRTNSYVFLFDNLKDMPDKTGIRGKTPLVGKNRKGLLFKLGKLKSSGINTVIDLRSAGECSSIVKDVLSFLNMKYVNFPVEDRAWTFKDLDCITKYINAINEENFYVGCANGQARTDLAVSINYILNPKAEVVPSLYYGSVSSSRVSVRDNIFQILSIVSENPEIVKDWGWNNYTQFEEIVSQRMKMLLKKISKM